MANEMDRVVPLGQLDDFRVAEGEPDVRGWEVLSADGLRIGKVDELLIDTNAMKVRYLDVDVDREFAAEDRHVLVPIGYARLERERDAIVVDTLQAEQLRTMPAYDRGNLTTDYESDLRSSWSGTSVADTATGGTAAHLADQSRTPGADTDFYAGQAYDDTRFYGSRRDTAGEARVTLSEEELRLGTREVSAGEVDISKRVETQHVREEIPLRHEEVTVERRPITDPLHAGSSPTITEDEIRIPLHAEEAVVEKRVVAKEELIVRKREVAETETVEADLRRERAEVTREGDTRADHLRADTTPGLHGTTGAEHTGLHGTPPRDGLPGERDGGAGGL